MFKSRFIILIGLFIVLLVPVSCRKAELTEEEQKGFTGCIEPMSLSGENALKYLRILVKGDSETIRYYGEYEKDENRIYIADRNALYQSDICAAVQVMSQSMNMISTASGNIFKTQSLPGGKHSVTPLSREEIKEIEEGYELILKVIEQKTGYPGARMCAIRVISRYSKFEDSGLYRGKRGVDTLKKVVNRDKDPGVRLEASGALLSLGQGDAALPVLNELAEAGTPQSVAALDKLFLPSHTELRDEKGKDILIKALNYSNDEVRAFAASGLAYIGVEKKLAEGTAIEVLKKLKNRKSGDYKNEAQRRSDRFAGYYAIAALEKIKSVDGINILKLIAESSDDVPLKTRAKMALKNIQQG